MTASVQATPVLFDESVLRQLAQDLGAETVQHLCGMAQTDLKDRARMMVQCYEEKNWDELRRHAHSLKSAAANCGLMELSGLMRQLEHAVQQQNRDEQNSDFVRDMVGKVPGLIERSLAALVQYNARGK